MILQQNFVLESGERWGTEVERGTPPCLSQTAAFIVDALSEKQLVIVKIHSHE